jgi:acyl-CoA synthetase (AMP-forming)/AMP-acid ligase II
VTERTPTLVAALHRAAELDLPGAGMRFLDRRERATLLSWAQVRERALHVAGGLQAAGIQPGDRVCIVLPTEPAFADAFFGVLLAGATPVPLYPPVRLGRLDEYFDRTAAMVRGSSARAILSSGRVLRVLGQVLDRVRPDCGLLDVAALAKNPPATAAVPRSADLALIQFSSGTTVAPKPVGLSHAQVLANARAVKDDLFTRFPESEGHAHCGVSWLPLYHDMGLIGCILPALDHPSSITLLPPEAFLAKPALWLRALSRYGGTISPAPDFAFALCVERIRDEQLEGVDLSRWVAALDGAEPISPANLRAFRDRFARWGLRPEALTPVYGLSEAALAVTFSPLDAPFRTVRVDAAQLSAGRAVTVEDGGIELASLGPPLPGFGVQIRSPEGAPLPESHVGAVHVSGPSLMTGYQDRDEQPIVDGWLDTGDRGFLHEGALVITGRAKDLIVLRGRNHAPQDIERAVDPVDGVRAGCAVAVANIGENGEELLVFVEVRTPRQGLAEDCSKAVLAATGLRPDLVLLLEPGTLPRTSSGKLRRGEALRRYQADALLPPDAVTPVRLAGALARSALARWRHR